MSLMPSKEELRNKRITTAATVLGWSSAILVGTGIRSAVRRWKKAPPEPELSLTDAALATTFGPLALCVMVYRVYFNAIPSFEIVKQTLLDAGVLSSSVLARTA
jgi:hypothetical protein